ncbi:MAG TPA: hypothetical protein VGN63_23705 [Flavisolibacter sp.]|jgi:uncharacterized tellurite resistance protein B-like protein|nr:hypothetical protein [Flavisolibacter sp.]
MTVIKSADAFRIHFPTFDKTLYMNLIIETEQEAAAAMLFSCVMYKHKNLMQSQVDQLSRIVVLCSRFKGTDLNQLTIKAISLQAQYDTKAMIEQSAPLIGEDFRETLFAMICEVITFRGNIDEKESEVLGMVALYLNIPVERMRILLTAFLIRNKWNVEIVEEMNG